MLLQYKITVNKFIISECVKFSFKNCPCHMLGHKLKIIIFLIVIRTYVCDNIHLGIYLIPSGQSFVFFFFFTLISMLCPAFCNVSVIAHAFLVISPWIF
jgi:hypothetical protein